MLPTMSMEIPLFVTAPALEPLRPRIAERTCAVLESGRYILGDEVRAFETEFAAYLGVKHCIGVGNGTDALAIGLLALGVGPGDEVVVPTLTFFATAEAAASIGARPVLCDVEEGTWCMSTATVEPLLSERTSAIVPVHLFGNPAPMDGIVELARSRGVRVLEDAAQAAGARLDGRSAGALGDAAAFSFYPSKNLGGIGDGGAVVTDDDEIAALVRRLRFHGSEDKVIHTEIGFNSRLDELQAAALRVELPYLDEWTASRRAAARAYAEAGLGELVELPRETPGAEACYHLYVVASEERDMLRQGLRRAGVGNRTYNVPPLHEQPALVPFVDGRAFPVAERYAREALAVPMGQSLTEEQAGRVVAAVRSVLRPD
jgi:dTDP-4-amino-4,6-dideoxygalactose transaminase